MKEQKYWDRFFQTGSIGDYLQYACTSEESQLEAQTRGRNAHDREGDGDGPCCDPDWGV